MRASTARRLILLVGGAAILGWLTARAGTGNIGRYLANLGTGLVVPLLLVGAQHGLRSLSWHAAVRATGHPLPWSHLLRARLGAETLGYLSLTGALGGQTGKVWLLREGVPLHTGAAAVLVDALASGIAGVLFAGVALLLSQWALGLPAWCAAIGGALVAVAIFAWLLAAVWSGQRRRRPPDPDSVLAAPTPQGWRASIRDTMRRMSAALVVLRGLPFARMILIHVAGHVALASATLSILLLLGITTSWGTGLLFEIGAKLGNVMGVFIPARLGMFEAGITAASDLARLGPAAGVAVGLVRRIVDLVWVGVGLLVMALGIPEPPADEGAETGSGRVNRAGEIAGSCRSASSAARR